MRILVIGAGGVGSAVVPIAARRDFFERMVVADYDAGRAERAIARFEGDERFTAARVDASKPDDVAALCREHAITHVLNAVDPRRRESHCALKKVTSIPIDMEVIYRAYRSVWTVLNYEKRLTDSDEAHELRDKVTRKLVEVAREGVIDLERFGSGHWQRLRDRNLLQTRVL